MRSLQQKAPLSRTAPKNELPFWPFPKEFARSLALDLTTKQWILAALAALSAGLSKGGFVGSGMVTVLLMAEVFPARASTGIVLPMLICADFVAVAVFRQHADWRVIVRLLPPAVAGIVAGYFCMNLIPPSLFRATMGWLVLVMVVLQMCRRWYGTRFAHIPHTRRFAWAMGSAAGLTTMLANAAGPVATLYLVALDMQKMQFVGTIAWFFCLVNLIKVPFSAQLGLITWDTLVFNALLTPLVVAGVLAGRRLLRHVPQKVYEALLLGFAALASLKPILQ